MNKHINTISFAPDDYMEFYKSLNKEDVNETKMYEDIQSFIRIAIKNGYHLKIWSDGYTTVIEYDYMDPSFTDMRLEWIDGSKTVKEDGDDE